MCKRFGNATINAYFLDLAKKAQFISDDIFFFHFIWVDF